MQLIYSHKQAVDSALKDTSQRYSNLKTLCDLGCGTGERTMLFDLPDRKLVGIDIRDYLVKESSKVSFTKGDIFKSSLPDSSFDIVFNFDVIEHLEHPEKLLKEIHRILKPTGICILSTPNRHRITSAILLLLGKRKYPYCINLEKADEYPEYWHLTEYTLGQIKKLLSNNKFKILEHHGIFYGLPGGMGLKKLANFPLYHNHILVLKKT